MSTPAFRKSNNSVPLSDNWTFFYTDTYEGRELWLMNRVLKLSQDL